MSEKYQISVNDRYQFDLDSSKIDQIDLVPNGNQAFHLLSEGNAGKIEIIHADFVQRTFELRVNGKLFKIQVKDQFDQLAAQLGLNKGSGAKQNHIKAPMPGLVLDVLVAAGQSVQKGDPLLILEAMKMENVIKAANDGVVAKIATTKGKPVEKGELLIELE